MVKHVFRANTNISQASCCCATAEEPPSPREPRWRAARAKAHTSLKRWVFWEIRASCSTGGRGGWR